MTTTAESVELVGEERTLNLARAAVFAAATSATAPVSVTHPLAPGVPVTLQTLWVFLAGIVLGPVWAGVAFGLYLVAGVVGLPVFAGAAGGIGHLLGPTGGFLVGFPVAAVVTGAVAHGLDGLDAPGEIPLPRLVVATVAGSVVVYAAGGVGYALVQSVDLATAVATVVLPFLPVGAVKVAGAVAVVRSDALVVR
jgi:biotin transport system substrate-specific component